MNDFHFKNYDQKNMKHHVKYKSVPQCKAHIIHYPVGQAVPTLQSGFGLSGPGNKGGQSLSDSLLKAKFNYTFYT